MRIPHLILALSALLFALVSHAPAQGGRGTPSVRPGPLPSRGAPGRGASPRSREGSRSVGGTVRDRAGRWSRLRRIEERIDPDDGVGRAPRDKDKKGKKEDRVKIGRELLATLRRDALKTRDVEIAWTVRVLEAKGGHRQFDVVYKALRVDADEMRHRFEVWKLAEGRPRRVAAWLVLEPLGGVARVWRATPGKSPELLRRRELAAGIDGTRLRLVDLLPFHPARYRLKYEGEADRGGRGVYLFQATDRIGLGERYELALDRDRRLLVKATGRAAARSRRTIVDSALRIRDDRPAFERRHVVFAASGDQVVAKMVKRRPNGGLDARLFEVETFEF